MPFLSGTSVKAFTYQGLNYKRCNHETLYFMPTEARHLQFLSTARQWLIGETLPTTLVESRKLCIKRTNWF